jgi:hypothetical protein
MIVNTGDATIGYWWKGMCIHQCFVVCVVHVDNANIIEVIRSGVHGGK